MVARAVLVDSAPQYGLAPTGTELPIISGDVTLNARSDVNSTLSLTVPGEWWDLVQPYGNEIFVERGVAFGNGGVEYAGLGFHRIEQADQDDAPYGPIKLVALDRTAQLQQNKLVFPIPLDEGTSHREVFQLLVNGGIADIYTVHGAYLDKPIPIEFLGYDPDTTRLVTDPIVEDDSYTFLTQLAGEKACALRFNAEGRLQIVSTTIDPSVAVATIRGGAGGSLIRASRSVSRRGVHNIVTAYGSDPSVPTDFIVAFNSDPGSPLAWNKATHPAFGPAPRYFASPLLQDDTEVEFAAASLLDRYTGLPLSLLCDVVPNPALEPDDVIDVELRAGLGMERHVIDKLTIPLTADKSGRITTRTLNSSEGLDDFE